MLKVFKNLFIFLTVHLSIVASARADSLTDLIHQRESKSSSLKIGFLVQQGNTTLQAYRADEYFTPASVQKIFTTNAVLKTLGGGYVFKTDFLYDSSHSSLTILPSGDPSITGESLLALLRVLEAYHYKNIKKVFLVAVKGDASISAHGMRAYESGVAPFSFNFNALGFHVCPTQKGLPAAVVPFSSLVDKTIKNDVVTVGEGKASSVSVDALPGGWALKGNMASDDGCADIYRSVPSPNEYALDELKKLGRAFDVVFATEAIEEKAEVPSNAKLLFSISSKPVKDLVATMNQQSSNFFADQFVLAIGKKVSGSFSFQAGLEEIRRLAGDPAAKIYDGSGLSRSDATTPKKLLEIFRGLITDERYRVALESSLPEYGASGTLKKRQAGLSCIVRAKTGTLDGVNSLVGVAFPSSTAQPVYFSLLQNGTVSMADGHAFEDEVLGRLCRLGQ